MNSRILSVLLPFCLLPGGCVATTDLYQDTQATQRAAQAEFLEYQRQLARGVDEAINAMQPDTQQNDPAWPVAANLSGSQRSILGDPIRPLDIESIMAGDKGSVQRVADTIKAAKKLAEEIEDRDAIIRDLEAKLLILAREAEEARRKSFFGRIKAALYSIGGILLVIMILYGLLVSGALPGIALRLGLVPAKVVRGIVRGTGHIRKELKKGKSLTIDEANQIMEPTTGKYDREWIRPLREQEDV